MVEMEISLVKAFEGWSLHDIDETAIETLLPFVGRFAGTVGEGGARVKQAFCDEVSWL